MTKDEIIKMTYLVGAKRLQEQNQDTEFLMSQDQLERFADLVADAEAKRIYDEGMVTVGHMREQIAAERERQAEAFQQILTATRNDTRAAEREAAEDRVITLFEEMDNPYLVDIVLAIKAKANQ